MRIFDEDDDDFDGEDDNEDGFGNDNDNPSGYEGTEELIDEDEDFLQNDESESQKEEEVKAENQGGFLNVLFGKFKGTAKSNKPNEAEMMREATLKFSVKRPNLKCPTCKQKSIFTAPFIKEMVYDALGTRTPHYACFNPKCPSYYGNHVLMKMSATGQLYVTMPSKLFKKV